MRFLAIGMSTPNGLHATSDSRVKTCQLALVAHCAMSIRKHRQINTVINNPGVTVCSYSKNR